MRYSRFISVSISSLVLCLMVLFGLYGCGGSSGGFDEATAVYSNVSGEKAMAHVGKLVGFGPRPAGSAALEESRKYIIAELESHGWKTQRQEVELLTPEGRIKFVNLRVRFGDKGWSQNPTGLICSHYDTKLFELFDFVGANDAGSSSGLLIELGRVLAKKPALAETLELVFFDGEEAFGNNITSDDGLFGSKHYAEQLLSIPAKKRPKWGVLLDMVGDKDLNINAAMQIRTASMRDLREAQVKGQTVDIMKVQESLEKIAKNLLLAAEDLGVRSKIGIGSDVIIDDHLPLNEVAGIPTIDLIDFDYGDYWHTPSDTLDKLSAESLETVGKVTLLLIEKYF